jgi:protein unc-13
VLDAALEPLKIFFHADGMGLKMTYFDKSSELESMKYALSLYTQTTDQLITTLIKTQKDQGRLIRF